MTLDLEWLIAGGLFLAAFITAGLMWLYSRGEEP